MWLPPILVVLRSCSVVEQFWQITSPLFSEATLSSWSVHTLCLLIGLCQTENWYDNTQLKISPRALNQANWDFLKIFNCWRMLWFNRKRTVQIFHNLQPFCGQIFWKVAWQRLTRGLTFCRKTKHFAEILWKIILLLSLIPLLKWQKALRDVPRNCHLNLLINSCRGAERMFHLNPFTPKQIIGMAHTKV